MNPAGTRATAPDELRAQIAELTQQIEGINQRFQLFTEATQEAIFILEEGRIVDVSREFEVLYGYTRDEVLGRSPKEFYASEDQQRIADHIQRPLLPIGLGVVVLPLVGQINQARASQVIETLVHGVFSHRAKVAIVDITGTRVADAAVADVLVRAARAVSFLGARAILTGINPDVAQVLVNLGSDLSGIVTYGTLQQGVRYALEHAATDARHRVG